ncbi:MAG TPA: AAA family ATPase [Azospirillaceae bacterium]|nr:AAA family ATPase [Azospirillaceae bacterium]
MDFGRFSDRARGAFQQAQMAATAARHPQLLPEHLLKALVDEADGAARRILVDAGGDVELLQSALTENLSRVQTVGGTGPHPIYVSSELAQVVQAAMADPEGGNGGAQDRPITTDRLLIALAAKSPAAALLLARSGANPQAIAEAAKRLQQAHPAGDGIDAGTDALRRYARDLTEEARAGRLDPVIGREDEIRRTVEVLARRTKNNPVLIGEPGVGKTAVVEGLARRIAAGDVPETLARTRVFALDMAALLAGAKFRGEFEERLKAVVAEVQAANGGIVLFIDELHTLVGAGRTDGSMDAANLLKPSLARGELRCIGATTPDEYRRHIERDAALARRFQPINVDEPTVEEAVSILRGLKERYEAHHGIRIADAAVVGAVKLASRYIADRRLPDKAIDLIDEAASRVRIALDSRPEPLDAADRRLVELRIEREALRNETDAASRTRLAAVEAEIAELEARVSVLEAEWSAEKARRGDTRRLKSELDAARARLATAQRNGAWQEAGELHYGVIPELERKLAEAEATDADTRREVTLKDVAGVVTRWTGIPVERMLEGDRDRVKDLAKALAARVVGQDEAVQTVAKAVRRARAGLKDGNRPVGSFLFLGPTGVGKTELARSLAAELFDDAEAFTRVDMSEYMERHTASRLVGAPPGYVGYDDGGTLVERVRRRPYQVLLLDEVEKAHPDVHNLLLQVLEDGRLTDGHGRTADFRHLVLIMTSNVGAEAIAELREEEVVEAARDEVMRALRSTFRPEFINRLDDVLLFRRLDRAEMARIVDIQLARVSAKLAEQNHVLEVDAAARGRIADLGWDPAFGARPLRRVIQTLVEDPIAERIVDGDLPADGAWRFSLSGGRLTLNGADVEPSGRVGFKAPVRPPIGFALPQAAAAPTAAPQDGAGATVH